jgi:hypothetical protein
MIVYIKSVLLLLLFLLFYKFFRHAFNALIKFSSRRSRLTYNYKTNKLRLIVNQTKVFRFMKHLEYLLASTDMRIQAFSFMGLSFMAFLLGVILGYFFFGSIRDVVLLSIFMGLSPYLLLRLLLLNLQMRTRLEFLPAVEIFYQQYGLSYHKNVRAVLSTVIQEQRISYPMRPVFEQLHRNLATNEALDESLQVFKMTIGHVWGDYFSNILKLGLERGVNITESLSELLTDMRRAKRSDHLAKNRLLEIRIANFSPILFLGVFLFINFKINPNQSYAYYILAAEGRQMLLDAVFMIFISFMMGVILSIRKM